VFFDIGPFEILTLVILGIVLFGPDRLPSAAVNAARMLRQFREFAQNARAEVTKDLGPEFQGLKIEDLNPKTFVRKNLFGDGDDLTLRELNELREDLKLDLDAIDQPVPPARRGDEPRLTPGERPPYDMDAT
jgi:sec-independent protein translocase protein TatB